MSTFFDDLDTVPTAGVSTSTDADIRANAHIVNGGTETFPCPGCKGSGHFKSYTGRIVGKCFKCAGAGTVSKGVVAAAKGKVTKAANAAQYRVDHAAEIEYLSARSHKWAVAADMLDKLNTYGSFTENTLAAIHRFMAADAAKRDERNEARAIETEAKSGDVDVTAIQALFARAVSNDLKRPMFRTEHLTIKASKRDAAVLYVTSPSDVYLGKIANGKFVARWEATAETLDTLRAVAADPQAEAVKYGRQTSCCGICGRGLVDPVSIRTGVGPICAERFGFVFARENARDEIRTETQAQADKADALPADMRAKGATPVARAAVKATVAASSGTGAVASCRAALAACNGDRATYISLCDTAGVARATANTQWTRLRK